MLVHHVIRPSAQKLVTLSTAKHRARKRLLRATLCCTCSNVIVINWCLVSLGARQVLIGSRARTPYTGTGDHTAPACGGQRVWREDLREMTSWRFCLLLFLPFLLALRRGILHRLIIATNSRKGGTDDRHWCTNFLDIRSRAGAFHFLEGRLLRATLRCTCSNVIVINWCLVSLGARQVLIGSRARTPDTGTGDHTAPARGGQRV